MSTNEIRANPLLALFSELQARCDYRDNQKLHVVHISITKANELMSMNFSEWVKGSGDTLGEADIDEILSATTKYGIAALNKFRVRNIVFSVSTDPTFMDVSCKSIAD